MGLASDPNLDRIGNKQTTSEVSLSIQAFQYPGLCLLKSSALNGNWFAEDDETTGHIMCCSCLHIFVTYTGTCCP